MSRKSARMTVGRSQPGSFVVADSTFELEIKDVTEIQEGKYISSDKILLMDFSDATWAFAIGEGIPCAGFLVAFYDFPEELKSKSRAELLVSCDGRGITADFHAGSISESHIMYKSEKLMKYSVNNAITLNCRLIVTCEFDSKLQRKFYDPQDARKSLLNRISNIFGDQTYTDFTFIVCKREFKVHMNILAAASPVMHRMFTGNLEEAKTKKCTIDAIDPEIFAHMLRFIYNAEIPENLVTIAMPLYEAGHYYDIENLKQICAQEIHESLLPVNALEVFEWAQPYDLPEIKLEAWAIIKRDILKIFVVLKYEPLSLEKINAIIKQRDQEKTFWEEIEEEVAIKTQK